MSRWIGRVRFPSGAPQRSVSQWPDGLPWKQADGGSNPSTPTICPRRWNVPGLLSQGAAVRSRPRAPNLCATSRLENTSVLQTEGLGSIPRSHTNCYTLVMNSPRTVYEANPLKCVKCGSPIPFEGRKKQVYCSRSCAQSINNLGRQRNKPRWVYCLGCSCKTRRPSRQCFRCEIDAKLTAGIHTSPGTIRKWLIRTRGHKCEKCGGGEWCGEPMPIEVDHIDGNHTNDMPNNLRLLCLNCHGLTPTFRVRNLGKGRTFRRVASGRHLILQIGAEGFDPPTRHHDKPDQ